MNNSGRKIQFMIDKTNHVLTSHGLKKIQENADFVEDESSHDDYVVFILQKEGSIAFRLAFSDAGVDIGINESYEVHSLAYEEIARDSGRYEEYLIDLFFKSIIVEKCSFGLRCYYAKDASKQIKLIRKIHYGIVGLIFPFLPACRIGCNSIEYKPMYKKGGLR
jgi:hypothetical protein